MVTAEKPRAARTIEAQLRPDTIKVLGATLVLTVDEDTSELLGAHVRVATGHDDEELQRAAERAVVAEFLPK